MEKVAKELSQILVVGSIVEAERATVAEIVAELDGEAFAELLDAGGHLLLADAFVLLSLGLGLEALPGQRAAVEVHEDVAERLEVVASTLLHAHVCVDRGVARRACEVLVLAVGDVLMGARIAELLGKAEVDDVDQVALFGQTHQKVVGLDVAMYEVLRVNELDAADLLSPVVTTMNNN